MESQDQCWTYWDEDLFKLCTSLDITNIHFIYVNNNWMNLKEINNLKCQVCDWSSATGVLWQWGNIHSCPKDGMEYQLIYEINKQTKQINFSKAGYIYIF